ncbi:SMEK domain-containing protein [Acinetobacter sp. YH12134]|uniref:SMEK domain-containing protein n=1 Tax=Acinetobacter sp. YH12134 TaxID=2601118 RepID=UPI0015D2AB7D|nr:SMEK domain-containing protein [Acinetobacter sp. YH12134]
MITRGYYIAQIIDNLALISSQIKLRVGLNQNDLNLYLEDFCKELLNQIYDYNLVNLNSERSNEPGIDLGDKSRKIAYQITSTNKLDKIKKTLVKCSGREQEFNTINILILQPKQKSYSLKNLKNKRIFNFSEKNILDFTDLCREIITLELDKLEKIYKKISKETAKVLIELEIQDINGNFPTDLNKYIEVKPTPKFKSADKLVNYIIDQNASDQEFNKVEEVNIIIEDIIIELQRLPKITRHILGYIFQESHWSDSGNGALIMKFSQFKRQTNYPNVRDDFEMLEESGLFHTVEIEDNRINLKVTLGNSNLALYIKDYLEKNDIDIINVFTNIDFSKL